MRKCHNRTEAHLFLLAVQSYCHWHFSRRSSRAPCLFLKTPLERVSWGWGSKRSWLDQFLSLYTCPMSDMSWRQIWFQFSLLDWDDLLFRCHTCADSQKPRLSCTHLKKKKNVDEGVFLPPAWKKKSTLLPKKRLIRLHLWTVSHALQGCHTFQDIHVSAVFMFPSTVS